MKKYVCLVISFIATLTLCCIPLLGSAASSVQSTENPIYHYRVQDDNTVCLTYADDSQFDGLWVVPETLDGYTVSDVTYIPYSVDSVVLPSGVKELHGYVYWASRVLRELHLPEGLERIEWYVANLQDSVVIPSSVTYISEKAFGWTSAPTPSGQTTVVGPALVPVENFTVYSFGNDVAKAYAEADGHLYVDLNAFDRGDLDANGTINMMDALTLYAMSSGEDYGSPLERAMADCTGDGEIGMMDTLKIYYIAAG